jgi:rifampicin phosphotransferase
MRRGPLPTSNLYQFKCSHEGLGSGPYSLAMDTFVLDLGVIDQTMAGLVGVKGANLGELFRVEGVDVPDGFCVTTDAFRQGMDGEVEDAIVGALERLGADRAYAVRSSSTAEDMPTASFAGQHDSFLDVVGREAILDAVRRCWASLTSDEAVAYRRAAGLDEGAAAMAVVVQRMAPARAAGVLFTADPLTSDRTVASVEAIRGLGEALVSGRANPDVYKVRGDAVIESEAREAPVLSEEEALRLAHLGRRIEAHFGRPQDIEWCLVDEGFQIVQSRPITTLFPLPPAADEETHVYLSVGHQQMMTDALRPLGLSVWQATTPHTMSEAGGRLFVDATKMLAGDSEEVGFVRNWERTDPLTGSALRRIVERPDFLPSFPDEAPGARMPLGGAASSIETDPAIVAELIAASEASLARLQSEIGEKSGAALVDFIAADFEELRRYLFAPRGMQVIMAGHEATLWLADELKAWLGKENVVDTLTGSLPDNVTAEMGLALLDVADAVRPHPDVVAFLGEVGDDDGFLDALPALPGGPEARDAILAFLDRYGMRCVGEIDISRPRWSERPSTLVPAILGNVTGFEAGAGGRRFREGLERARAKEAEVLERLRALPDGEAKAAEAKRNIDRARTFNGYREYPKFGMVNRYAVYKRALWAEADRLAREGAIGEADDIAYLRLEELRDALGEGRVDQALVARRKQEFRAFEALTPPRVMTSDGEVVTGSYGGAGVPAGALAGLPVSAGTVEGRARVIADIADAELEPGDILVTTFTDPSWTPLFVGAAGLVTEIGGLMTHGAVIAREYGLPAVVGVEDATGLIEDGRMIRVDGAAGYVELLPEE